MKQEEKTLLLRDLCARLPYGVKCAIFDKKIEFGGFDGKYPFILDGITVETSEVDVWLEKANFSLETIKPYLRPMSSMTEEEQKEFVQFHCVNICPIVITDMLTLDNESDMFDWLNMHHFDYRGLIEKGLAFEAPEGMYDTKQ